MCKSEQIRWVRVQVGPLAHVLWPLCVFSPFSVVQLRDHLVLRKLGYQSPTGRTEAIQSRLAAEHHFKPWRESFTLRSDA